MVRAVIEGGVKSLVIHTKLNSPNEWTNKKNGTRIYASIRNRWTKIFQSHGLLLWGGHKGRNRELVAIYYVPDGRAKLRDQTNQEGCFKPIEDAMKIAGLLFDDNARRYRRLPLQQIVDPSLDGPVLSLTLRDKEPE